MSGLTGRDDQEDAALWCALVTQRANEQYGHRAAADKPEPDQPSSKGQGFHELEVFECLSRLCGAGAGDPASLVALLKGGIPSSKDYATWSLSLSICPCA